MLLMPLPIGMIFILIALLYLHKKRLRKARFMVTLSVIWLFTWSYSPLVNTLLTPLESSYLTLNKVPQNIGYIYVLGGGHTTDHTQPITSQINESAVIRLNEGIRLYHKLKQNTKLILSGYSGLHGHTSHAVMQSRLAQALGINKEHLILFSEPKDTQEEAMMAKKVLGDAPFILVTSASHMMRAMKFFTHEGLSPLPAPTDHKASMKELNYTDIFSSHALEKSRILFHEILGLLWQKIKGI